MKHFIKLFSAVALVVVLLFSGCSLFTPEEKDFTKAGMTITLTEAFSEQEMVNYVATYVSTKIGIITTKEEKALFADYEVKTVDDYIALVKESNTKIESAEVKTEDGLKYVIFEAEENGDNYKYTAFFYETDDAFWIVQIYSRVKDYDDLKYTIIGYAKSVKFA